MKLLHVERIRHDYLQFDELSITLDCVLFNLTKNLTYGH